MKSRGIRWLRYLLALGVVVTLHFTFSAVSTVLRGDPEDGQQISYRTPSSIEEIGETASGPIEEAHEESLPPSQPEVPPGLVPAVEFWKKVYASYTSEQVLLHDSEDLSIIYGVVDFGHLRSLYASDLEFAKARERSLEWEMERLKARLPRDRAKNLRSQTGLRDQFSEAIQASGRYLDRFEEIFQSYGVPTEITRLVFVESLFQEKARSHVGAAGLWQFMPGTAKRYLTVGHLIDERYDPIRATHAAAQLLRRNFEELGSWPLAITAYNTGARQVERASRAVGSRDIDKIIAGYRGQTFGFASRNFYPEFLAALAVYEDSERFFGIVTRHPRLEYDRIILPVHATFSQIAFLSESTLQDLKSLNPSYKNDVFHGGYVLAPGSELRVPPGKKGVFVARFVEHVGFNREIPADLAKTE